MMVLVVEDTIGRVIVTLSCEEMGRQSSACSRFRVGWSVPGELETRDVILLTATPGSPTCRSMPRPKPKARCCGRLSLGPKRYLSRNSTDSHSLHGTSLCKKPALAMMLQRGKSSRPLLKEKARPFPRKLQASL